MFNCAEESDSSRLCQIVRYRGLKLTQLEDVRPSVSTWKFLYSLNLEVSLLSSRT